MPRVRGTPIDEKGGIGGADRDAGEDPYPSTRYSRLRVFFRGGGICAGRACFAVGSYHAHGVLALSGVRAGVCCGAIGIRNLVTGAVGNSVGSRDFQGSGQA